MVENIIIIAVLAIIIVGAALYVYKKKKSGATCIGCPHSGECAKGKCNCHSEKTDK